MLNLLTWPWSFNVVQTVPSINQGIYSSKLSNVFISYSLLSPSNWNTGTGFRRVFTASIDNSMWMGTTVRLNNYQYIMPWTLVTSYCNNKFNHSHRIWHYSQLWHYILMILSSIVGPVHNLSNLRLYNLNADTVNRRVSPLHLSNWR